MSANTVTKTLRKPWTVAGHKVNDVELREPTLKDFIEAEKDGNPNWAPHAYRAALAAQTIVRAGNFTGPFAAAQFTSMPGSNWRQIEAALIEAEALGEDEPPSQALSN